MPHAIRRGYEHVLTAGLALSGVMLAGMALIVTLDVMLRALGWGSISWQVEVSEYLLYLATFTGAPWVLRQGAHVRVDVIVRGLPPGFAAALDRAVAALGLAVCAVLVTYGAAAAWDAFGSGSLIMKQLVVAEWWLLAFIPLAAALLAVEFALRLLAPAPANSGVEGA